MTSPDSAEIVFEGEEGNQKPVVFASGEMDGATTPLLKEALDEASSISNELTIDFADVTYFESTALAAIVSTLKKVREAGGDLTIRNLSPKQMKYFEITGLKDVLKLIPEAPPETEQ